MSDIAIIPARGGSKRIPMKNIKEFLGKPIIAYSIETALKSHLFDEVIVSTDDNEIAKIANQYGANVPFMRSIKNSSDYATTVEVLIEVLNNYKTIGWEFDNCCCIYPTAPFIDVSDLENGRKKIKDGIEGAIPIVPFEYPIWRGLYLSNGFIKMVWPEYETTRSQDLETIWHDAGQWYWLCTKGVIEQETLFLKNMVGIQLPSIKVQDIDNEEDWRLAEVKFQMLNYSNYG